MARSSTLRKRALKRMASQPPPAVEVRPSGIELREVYDDMPSAPLVLDEVSSTSVESAGSIAPTVQSFDHHDESFFGADMQHEEENHFDDVPEDRHSQAHVVARRTRASSMVRNVLVGCAALVAVGFAAQHVRASYEQKHEESLRASAAMSLSAANTANATPVEPPGAAALAAPPAIPPVTVAVGVAPEVAAPAAAAPVAALPTTSPEAPAASPPAEDKPVIDVKAEKRKAEQALDLGKYAAALEHAEKAVEGDGEDAGAWLLLGAVKQAKGDMKGATAAFSKCVKDAKRGPKHECAAMMR